MPLVAKKVKTQKLRNLVAFWSHTPVTWPKMTIFFLPLYSSCRYISPKMYGLMALFAMVRREIHIELFGISVPNLLIIIVVIIILKTQPQAQFWRYWLINMRCIISKRVADLVKNSARNTGGFPEKNAWEYIELHLRSFRRTIKMSVKSRIFKIRTKKSQMCRLGRSLGGEKFSRKFDQLPGEKFPKTYILNF